MLRKRIIIGAIAACLVGGSAIAAVMYVNSQLNKLERDEEVPQEEVVINEEAPMETLEGYTNIALFGVDARDGSLNDRTDTMIIASINNETHEIKLVSLYRDTYLNVADGNDTFTKANAAYAQGGPKQAMEMMNMNLDLDITDYITVNFEALSKAVDLMDGLDMDISQEEITQINKWIDETSNVSGIDTQHMEIDPEHPEDEEYTYHMDGVQVTTYARIRSTAGDDYRRTERQRYVLECMFEQAKEMDWSVLLDIVDEVFPLVATNLTNSDIINLGMNILKYELTDQLGFPFNQTAKTISGKGSCVIPDDLAADVAELHKLLFDVDDYVASGTVQEITASINGATSTIEAIPQDDYVSGNSSSGTTSNSSSSSGSSSSTPSSGGGTSSSDTPNLEADVTPAETEPAPETGDSGTEGTGNEGSTGGGDADTGAGDSGGGDTGGGTEQQTEAE